MIFLLLHDRRDSALPFRAVGGATLGVWKYDRSFRDEKKAVDQLLEWFFEEPDCEFHDLTK